MPTFDLRDGIPGVALPPAFSLDGDPGETVEVRLTGGVLHQSDAAAPLVLSASYEAATRTLKLERQFAPPARFIGGSIELAELELEVRCAAAAGGSLVIDRAVAAPVEATGSARWVGDGPEALGAPGSTLAFELSLAPDGLELEISAPVTLTRVAVELRAGSLAAQVLPDEQALLLTLAGEAALAQSVATQIEDGLEQVFGAGRAPDLAPPAFRAQQKLRLADLAPLEPPRLSLFPAWEAGAPPALPDLAAGLSVTLGLPRFDFAFPDGGGAPDFGFGFRDCAIRFPELPGFESLTLQGNLEFLDGPGSDWALGFEPSLPGAIQMPAMLRFLLARIAWLAEAPELDDLSGLLSLSQGDFEWYELFEGLLPDIGDPIDGGFLAGFGPAFDGIVVAALALPDAPDLPDLFAIAFAALEERADELYAAVVDAWGSSGATLEQAIDLLLRLAADLEPPDFDRFLAELLPRFDELIAGLLEWAATQPLAALDDFLRLWVRVLAAALEALDPDRLAGLIDDALKAASADLGSPIHLGDLPMLSGVPGLRAPSFRLSLGSALTGLGMSGLALSSDLPTGGPSGASFADAVIDFADAIERAIASLLAPISNLGVDATRVCALFAALITNAEGDPESEVGLLQWSRIPIFGQLLALVAAVRNLLVRPVPWTDLLWSPIEDNPKLKVKRLPRPRKGANTSQDVKYLILSDIHRDAASDVRPLFERGSIAHFRDNRELYLEILEWADEENYTVLEAGDCEELWFIRDFSAYDGPADQLRQVMEAHPAVYDKLVELHGKGRYFRCYGNHDSYLRDPATRQRLVDRFEDPNPGKPFEIYDYFIVDGVSQMDEHGLADVAEDVWNSATAPEHRLAKFVEDLTEGRLGLDSEPYTDAGSSATKLIVTHGHQFDFWNCDEHSLFGKMLANGIGVLADIHDDPFQDLGGLAFGGAPLVDFEGFFAAAPVFSNFPSYDPSRAFAHRIQHMHESDRLLINDLFYFEMLPALLASWAMPIHLRSDWPDGAPDTRWTQSSPNPWAATGFTKFLGNAISVGHTHYPQSRPYYDIAALLFGPATVLVDVLRELISGLLFGLYKPSINIIKSQYYNSGTSGWMEGVVWAVEVDGHGQARSIFWTRDTRVDRPQEMDWELQRFSDAKRDALTAKRQELGREVEAWLDRFLAVITAAGTGAAALTTTALLALRDLLSAGADVELQEVDVAATPADELPAQLEQASTQIGGIVLQLMLALTARQLGDALPAQTMRVSVPVDGAVAGRMSELEGILGALPDVADEAAGNVAALWMIASEQLPFVNGGERGRESTPYPVLKNVLALLPMLPAVGMAIADADVSADVVVADGRLTLTITVD